MSIVTWFLVSPHLLASLSDKRVLHGFELYTNGIVLHACLCHCCSSQHNVPEIISVAESGHNALVSRPCWSAARLSDSERCLCFLGLTNSTAGDTCVRVSLVDVSWSGTAGSREVPIFSLIRWCQLVSHNASYVPTSSVKVCQWLCIPTGSWYFMFVSLLLSCCSE